MARKDSGASAVATADEKTQTMSALIEVEVCEPVGYCAQHFHFNVTHKLAKRFRMLKDALHSSGRTFDDGNGLKHVDSDADVFRYFLAALEVN